MDSDEPPKLDYATPRETENRNQGPRNIIGLLGFIIYSLLAFPFVYGILAILFSGRRPPMRLFAILGCFAAFFCWRAVSAFRQFLTKYYP